MVWKNSFKKSCNSSEMHDCFCLAALTNGIFISCSCLQLFLIKPALQRCLHTVDHFEVFNSNRSLKA